MRQNSAENSAEAFLSGGGEAGMLMRQLDWAANPLGPAADWPQGLKVLVGVMLGSKQPMFIAWGAERIMLYNDGYAELLQDRHPSAMGQLFDRVWYDILKDVGPILDSAYAGIASSMDDIMFMMMRGGVRVETHFSFSYTPVRDQGGDVIGMFCACAETTQQVLAERRLIHERTSFAALFEQAPSFMAMLRGPEHRIELANPGYLRLVGDRDVIGRTVEEALPVAVAQGYLTLLNDVFHNQKAFSAVGYPYAVQAVAGGSIEQRFIDFVYQPITDNTGASTGVFVEGFDVTDREAKDRALRDSEAQLRELNADLERQVVERSAIGGRFWQTTPDLLGVIDPEGRFANSNPAWQTGLGRSESELRSRPLFELVHPEDHDRTKSAFEQLRRGEPILRFENRYRHRDGTYRWFAWTAAPLGEDYYWSGRDITEVKDKDEALQQAEDLLRQSQKMEAVGQLTGGLAHDFNNLLTGITGSLELIQKRVLQGRISELDRYIIGAQGAAKRAAALTHRLLAFSRRQTLDPRPVDVNRLVSDMEELVRRTVGPSITLEVAGAGGLWTSFVDPNQLENALLNLCINARDAMPDGGRLTIETANRWLDDRAGRDRNMPRGQYVSLCVSDTGTGMTPEVIKRAFDPFFTTKPIGEGNGLGLSMIYGFAQQSGGQVRIYSEVGDGTMVCIYLPRHFGDASEVHTESDIDEPAKAMAGETVLVIDDEPSVRMLVVDVLHELGYAAIEAADGPSGLKILQSGARIDLLISDVGLPGGMNGRQVADAARQHRPDLKVLFITGYAENAVVGNGHLHPGMHVMTKPFPMDALANRIKDILNER